MATASTYTLLQRISVTSPVSSVTFSSIPTTGYTDLKIVASARCSGTGYGPYHLISFNGSASNFSSKQLYGNQVGTGSNSVTQMAGYFNDASSTANTFGSTEIYIPNYTSSNAKSYSADSVEENGGSNFDMDLVAGLWNPGTQAAITSITLTTSAGNYVQNSTFSLYAMSAVGTTPGTPKALGGDIVVSDGSYWYHAFLNSGTFTPQSALSCDVLVVAGGGGGTGNSNPVGGGGAGGFRALTSQSFSTIVYPVTIGAGGTGGSGFSTAGSNSNISTISATGGGNSNITGGSGGGGNRDGGSSGAAGNAGGYSPVEGYAGGTSPSGSWIGAAGGGGAGGTGYAGTGGSATAERGGYGGVGSYSSISGGSTTSVGVLSGGNYYFAGGGGGGAESGGRGGVATGGLGGGGNGSNGNVTAATSGFVNTGGGGGGAGISSGSGGNGGSGIIVIKYAV